MTIRLTVEPGMKFKGANTGNVYRVVRADPKDKGRGRLWVVVNTDPAFGGHEQIANLGNTDVYSLVES